MDDAAEVERSPNDDDPLFVGQWQDLRCQEEMSVEIDGANLSLLCNACKHILTASELCHTSDFDGDPERGPKARVPFNAECRHIQSRTVLESSARRGCRLRALLFRIIQRVLARDGLILLGNICYEFLHHSMDTGDSIITFNYDCGKADDASYKRRLTGIDPSIVISSGPSELVFISSYITHLILAAMEAIDRSRLDAFAPQTLSQDSVRLMRQWSDTCFRTHKECGKRRRHGDYFPTRLLYVGTSMKPVLYLVEGRDVQKDECYITLSHCWGNGRSIVLQNENIEAFKDQIDSEKLPLTFKHAIYWTRRFSIPYLWIDSLCIIQNSPQDWEQEAAKMKDVYTNTILTLAATGAQNSTQGFIFQRNASLVEPVVAHVFLEPPFRGIYTLYDIRFWTENMELAPLNQRGWVIQERVLSPRVLHFGRHQLAWECQELEACETFPTGRPCVWSCTRIKNLLNADAEDWASKWENVVTTYSKCQLTYEGDICIAIAGIAEIFQTATNDTYLAGLWVGSLISQLCWATQEVAHGERQVIPTRPLKYRAPSWSWMSIKGGVEFFFNLHEKSVLFEILGYNIQNTENNMYGSIASGYISGRGILKPASWRQRCNSETKDLVIDEHEVVHELYWETSIAIVRMDLGLKEPSCNVFCVPLVKDQESYVHTYDYAYVGLILLPVNGRQDTYRRVGTFYFEGDFGDKIFMQHNDKGESQTYLPKSTFTIV